MKNNFSYTTRELFDFGGYSVDWETGLNNADCLHHIMGRISNSPYNAAPLNNFDTHQPEGRLKRNLGSINSFDVRKRLLKKTKKYLDDIGYIPNSDDYEFLRTNKTYYK